ncbi:3-dehydroquinate synthase AroB [Gottschalkia purinilytica]|uniref:3-dehydroquinate synthase n=1 Tax=Gottschalkia purinilytica TaxID=1503 RepID=A0A0L0WEV0_GOTPU|nr:3-dehydroquinate synthase [Gottschalkia purinilytica]KNF09994.1 3-dehydroquinate synthase AroB [Gottschalkia purinilytica]
MYELNIKLPDKKYDIFIQKGIINNIGEEIKKIYKNKKIFVITDSNVNRIYGEQLKKNLANSGFEVYFVVVEAGEKSKSISVLEYVYNQLLENGITRGDVIVTFGGGVVGDLGGFVASTLLRGIKFIQIPTSLLSQIDSSIGGKVAVNLPIGKNLVGSFYHPEVVYIDPELLKTLEKRFLYDGMAEVIKYGCIRDKQLLEKLLLYESEEELFKNIEEVIYKCCDIKRAIVEEDEKDTGIRMILNFGHTIGHAIERYFDYEKYTHGEAVAMGMYHITQKSESLNETEKGTANIIKDVLIKYNLSYELPDMKKEKILEAINLDKKSNADSISIVLLDNIGNGYLKKIKREEIFDYI